MSRKKRELSDDEAKLWRRVASTVKPRRASVKADARSDSTPVAPVRVTAKAPDPAPSRTTKYVPKPELRPADRGAEKRVRRGKLDIDGTLDLHGHKQDTAYAALAQFLQGAQRRGSRVVLVVTGVGRSGPGVLKSRLPDWLASRELKPLIAGYAQAHRAHGGAGAFYVFLKRAD